MSHILFVGDDAALQSLHVQVAAELGHTCDVAATGAEALDELRSRPYDLLIAHERIRPCDGLSWLRRIRTTVAPATPCVLEGSSALALDAARAGIHEVVTLPLDAADVRRAIRRGLLRPLSAHPAPRAQGPFDALRREAAHVAWGARLQTADVLLERMEEHGLGVAVARGRRLAGAAAAVARALDLARDEIEDIQIGAMLHDVGLLLQPRPPHDRHLPLPPDTWERQRTHPADGAALLRSIPLLAGAASVVEHSHERHDGLGHPAGRAGAEIPTGARIFAVVEAFDDLLHGEEGQPPVGVEEALEAVEAGAGHRFDPDATAALAPALPELLRARLRQARGA